MKTKNELPKAELTPRTGSRRADWVDREAMGHVLAALMPENRLAVEIAMSTGLRISDVLSIKTEQIRDKKITQGRRNTITMKDLKNCKNPRV